MQRLGVVLPVPAPVEREVRGLQRALRGRSRIGPHVTLVPPVNADVASAGEVARRTADRTPPLHLRLGPVSTFWPVTPVVYLAVAGDLDALGRARGSVLSGPLAEPPGRPVAYPFVPHVTLAEHVAEERIAGAVDALGGYEADAVFDRLHLLEEDATGAWRVVLDLPLGGPRVVGRGGLEVSLTGGSVPDAEAGTFFDWAWRGHVGRETRAFTVTARREAAVVGIATGTEDGDELWLDRLVVDPSARSQGVGGHLLAEVEHVGRSAGCMVAMLVCRAGGGAEDFYRERGWSADLDLPAWRHGNAFVRMVRRLAS